MMSSPHLPSREPGETPAPRDDALLTAQELAEDALLEWLHRSPLNRCDMGSDTCATRPIAAEIVSIVLRAASGGRDASGLSVT